MPEDRTLHSHRYENLKFYVKRNFIINLPSMLSFWKLYIQSVLGGKVNILGDHSVGHSEQKIVYVHVSYSERFPG
jgi:hypothetical protein